VLAEAGARLLEPEQAGERLVGDIGERVDDPVLDYRTLPNTGDNDAAGHRNPQRLAHADVVALGDSQTWGVNASMGETWPARLADLTGRSVYNMGRGGYGIVQYRYQLEDALDLDPEWVVVALYFGNDIFDAFSLAYSHDAHAGLRHPDESMRQRIVESAYPDLQRIFFERLAYGRDSEVEPNWLARRSALVRMIRRAGEDRADPEADRAWAHDHPEDGFVYDDGRISTVFHTRYRLAAVDSALPKIREGTRITLVLLQDMQARIARAQGARLLVVLIPTKERIFARAVEAGGVPEALPTSYRRSVVEEQRIASGLMSRMDSLGIAHLDLLPVLEEAIARGDPIFPRNADGHFTPRGYERIAEAIALSLDEDSGLEVSP
jgi:hypothetical protein